VGCVYAEKRNQIPQVLIIRKTTPAEERVGQRRQVVIKRKRAVLSDDTLSPEDAKIVRRGEAQLKRGESKSWRSVKHTLPR
jgi:hypothetical protein